MTKSMQVTNKQSILVDSITCCKDEAGEGSLSSDFHSRSIWFTCSSRRVTSTPLLSFLANWRSKSIPCKSSTRFLALSLNSLCEVDLQVILDLFPVIRNTNTDSAKHTQRKTITYGGKIVAFDQTLERKQLRNKESIMHRVKSNNISSTTQSC